MRPESKAMLQTSKTVWIEPKKIVTVSIWGGELNLELEGLNRHCGTVVVADKYFRDICDYLGFREEAMKALVAEDAARGKKLWHEAKLAMGK